MVTPADTVLTDVIYVPNVFTPNGDGINDRFKIFSKHPNTYLDELTIFDRWGNLIFSINNISLEYLSGWDGTFKGKPMNPQVFTYKAKIKLADERESILYGDATLIR